MNIAGPVKFEVYIGFNVTCVFKLAVSLCLIGVPFLRHSHNFTLCIMLHTFFPYACSEMGVAEGVNAPWTKATWLGSSAQDGWSGL